jgi:hypothetical protein
MKKYLIIIFILFLFLSVVKVEAKTIKVIAVDKFSTTNPPATYRVRVAETETLKDGILLEKGTLIYGNVIKTHKPKRGKIDSSFEFHPTYIHNNEENINLSHSKIFATVVGYKPVDPEKLIGSLAIKAANFIVLGASQAISFTIGAWNSPNGCRIKSGLNKMYRDSFVSFIEVGEELNVDAGDTLLLRI